MANTTKKKPAKKSGIATKAKRGVKKLAVKAMRAKKAITAKSKTHNRAAA